MEPDASPSVIIGPINPKPGDGYTRYLFKTTTTTHNYVTQNGKVVRDTITNSMDSTKVLDFLYNTNGTPYALIYTNGTATPETYYYVLNLQGDVLMLLDEDGAIVARYSYNAWGEILGVTDQNGNRITDANNIAHLNPLRYRGYYYDTETGFYYLQSRYYDPANCRFINADCYASTGQGYLGSNMFAYCGNNPINNMDVAGKSWTTVFATFHCGNSGKGGEPYDREAAVNYALEWHDSRNYDFYAYGEDCTNFVSQCLFAGGIEMTDDWHSYRSDKTYWYNPIAWLFVNYRYDWDVSRAWRLASVHYDYFCSDATNTVVSITSIAQIAEVSYYSGVQKGDILYFSNGSQITHVAIITQVANGRIYYAAHTDDYRYRDLNDSLGSQIVYIVKIGH